MHKSEILARYTNCYSCKLFSERKISEEDFMLILESGRLAPSVFGFEPWKFLVIQDTGIRAGIQQYTPLWSSQIATCSHLVVFLAATGETIRYDSVYVEYILSQIQHLSAEEVKKVIWLFQIYQENMTDISDDEEWLFAFSCKQSYLPLAHMLMTATGLWVNSCAIEWFFKDKVNTFLAEECAVDLLKYRVSHMATFGYAKDNTVPQKIRQSLDTLVQWW